jgi:carboxyl-terminal processing protease
MVATWNKLSIWLGLLPLLTALMACDSPARAPQARGPSEGELAALSARLLEKEHYTRHPFDNEIAAKFFDGYLDELDGQHLNFLQTDLDEFAPYRATLDELTKAGNTVPAHAIFRRYLHRLEQQAAYATNLLHSETFEFAGQDRCTPNRHDLPWPHDLAAAQALWRERLRFEYLQEKLNGKAPAEILERLTRRYTGLLRTMRDLGQDQVLELYLTALGNAYDPHSVYLGPSNFEDLNIGMRLSLVGIGAELAVEDGYTTIRRILPGPAARSGQLKPGDRITAVAQEHQPPVDVVDMPLPKVVELIRGRPGTPVRLTIQPVDAADPAARKTVTLVREEIQLEDEEARARLLEYPAGQGQTLRLGLIDLPSFYEDMETDNANHKSSTTDVAKLLDKLKREHVQGLILDLRQNGGGSLDEAIRLSGLFIRKGPVVQVKDASGKVRVYADKDPATHYDGPLIVLSSRGSASASEILAGALQDYRRALLVGDASTFGKGTVQSVIELGPLLREVGLRTSGSAGAWTLTIQKFYRPSGSSTQRRGVVPDLVLPSLGNEADWGEASLSNPLPWDTISPAKYQPMDRVGPYLSELQRRSAQRVATEKEFGYLKAAIALVHQRQGEKSVSLNEAERRREQTQLAAQLEAWKKDVQAHPQPQPTTYEITLRNAGRPGLPAPGLKTNSLAAADLHRQADLEDLDDLPDRLDTGVDITLEETERILADYVEMSHGQKLARGRSGR